MDVYGCTRVKYDVPLNHLDYEYIAKCENKDELEKIIKILRSGDEGTFPELEKCAEQKLLQLDPDNKLLRREEKLKTPRDLDKSEWQQIDSDLQSWMSDVKQAEKSLSATDIVSPEENLPPVRGTTSINTNKTKQASSSSSSTKGASQKRVKPREYREWDKIDVDAELEKVETEKNIVFDNTEMANRPRVPEVVDSSGLSAELRQLKADREKDKGNEAFRAGDFQEALTYYSRSLSLLETVAARNNRAQTYLKLKNFNKALDDCESVLKAEPTNLKALLRRAVANQGLNRFVAAERDLKTVLDKEPNNKQAAFVMSEVVKSLSNQKTTGRRIVIEEVDGSDTEDNKKKGGKGQRSKGRASVDSKGQGSKGGASIDSKGQGSKGGVSEGSVGRGDKSEAGKGSSQVSDESQAGKGSSQVSDVSQAGKGSSQVSDESQAGKDSSQVSDESEKVSEKVSERGDVTAQKLDNSCDRQTNGIADSRIPSAGGDVVPPASDSSAGPLPPTAGVQLPSLGSESQLSALAESLSPAVAALKDAGNDLFRKGQYGDALNKYNAAVQLMTAECGEPGGLCVLYSNRAACLMKVGDCQACIADCNSALALCPGSAKPLLRRAMAYEALEKYRQAFVDYRQVLLTSCSDVAQQGSDRCASMLQRVDGPMWRDKLPAMSSSSNLAGLVAQQTPPSQAQTTQAAPSQAQTTRSAQTPSEGLTCQQQPSANAAQSSSQTSTVAANEKLYETCKTEGNALFTKGEYIAAIELFSKCIEMFPERVVPYTNRALCYLRLNKYELVLSDCNQALSLDFHNVKALFRRAQAYKMQQRYEESMIDLETLLKIDATNSAAKKELETVLKNKQQEQEKRIEASLRKQRQRVHIEEVDSSSDEELSASPRGKKQSSRLPTGVSRSDTRHVESSAASSTSPQVTTATSGRPATTGSRPGCTKSPVTPSGKLSAFEFLQTWNGLKGTKHMESYVELLDSLEPTQLPKVISNKLDSDFLMLIVRCVTQLVSKGCVVKGFEFLRMLSTVPRFDTIIMFLSDNEKTEVQGVFEKISAVKDCPIDTSLLAQTCRKFTV